MRTPLESDWRVIPGSKLEWRHWRDEHAVFNALSGDTHALSDAAATVLKHLEEGSLGFSEIVGVIGREYEVDAETDVEKTVAEIIRKLESLNLIEPVPREPLRPAAS